MQLVESYLTNNPCYKNNVNKVDSRYTTFQERGPIGLMLHSVGCAQPNASVFIKNWNKSTYDAACVHGFIDANTGTVYQCLPWNFRGWHGGGSSNNTHVGVEMCEPDCITYIGGAKFTCSNLERARAMATRTYDAAVELYAMLCQKYNLDPVKAIISHSEGAKMGIAANHSDPEHLWNQLGLPYTMDTFRKAVKACMDSGTVPPPLPPAVQIAKPTLAIKSRGNNVKLLQQNLIAAGFSLPRYGADGDFGQETRSAVIAFQKSAFPTESKEWDGIYGSKTYQKLDERLNR